VSRFSSSCPQVSHTSLKLAGLTRQHILVDKVCEKEEHTTLSEKLIKSKRINRYVHPARFEGMLTDRSKKRLSVLYLSLKVKRVRRQVSSIFRNCSRPRRPRRVRRSKRPTRRMWSRYRLSDILYISSLPAM
jgi:hypothetical protein